LYKKTTVENGTSHWTTPLLDEGLCPHLYGGGVTNVAPGDWSEDEERGEEKKDKKNTNRKDLDRKVVKERSAPV